MVQGKDISGAVLIAAANGDMKEKARRLSSDDCKSAQRKGKVARLQNCRVLQLYQMLLTSDLESGFPLT